MSNVQFPYWPGVHALTARETLSAALGVVVTLTATHQADARDILRGSVRPGMKTSSVTQTTTAATGAAASSATTAARAALLAGRAKDSLNRTAQALAALRAAQNAAAKLALTRPSNAGNNLPNVPDGIVTGGLVPTSGIPAAGSDPGTYTVPSSWTGIGLLTQTTTPSTNTATGKTTVTITQNEQQALLNWETFNIGKNTKLVFDQSAGGKNKTEWIAFNKINDPSGVPSQILGSIEAAGQVYVINQNGIIFGGGSQINVHTLVASALPINNNLIQRGLLDNPDMQCLFSSLEIPALSGGSMPGFTPESNKSGDVIVQEGATISCPTTADHVGGRIALVGANVSNVGTLSTPDGQTILAAGQQVAFLPHATTDPSLRGLDVYIGQGGGTATNEVQGIIDAPRANVTIAGKTVNQLGAIHSTTSVSLNGRIDLLANYNVTRAFVNNKLVLSPGASGEVNLGQGSVTQILPELWSTDAVVGQKLSLLSQVNIQGKSVYLAEDSTLLAPNANVMISAGNWVPSTNGGTEFVYDAGQVYLDKNAVIDVSGSIVDDSVADNIISVQLLGSELANSPLLRDGALRGKTIHIDIRQTGVYNGQTWIGTPLADASGYVNLIKSNVGQLTTAGGSVIIKAGGAVVMQNGSKIDVSGGYINYKGATVETTKVVSGGNIYDISQATPDRIYDGLLQGSTTTHLKWGISKTYTNQLLNGTHYEAGYIQGGNGGSLSVTAPAMALDGNLHGNTVTGPYQRTSDTLPKASSLSLSFQGQKFIPSLGLYMPASPTPPRITFQADNTQATADTFDSTALDSMSLREDRRKDVVLSPDLVNTHGFGSLNINNPDGDIIVPANISLTTDAKGSITLAGANVTIDGKLSAAGGNLSLSAYNISPFQAAIDKASPGAQTPSANPERGRITLGASASLTTAGLIVNDHAKSSTIGTVPIITNGGTISIQSYDVNLVDGSVIDASGGLAIGSTGKLTYGKGGSIAIEAGQDQSIPSVIGGHLTWGDSYKSGESLKGYAGSNGGSLSIQAPLIEIGKTKTKENAFLLTPDFFSHGGFATFNITGIAMAGANPTDYLPGLLIAPHTEIKPVAQNWVAQPDPSHPGETMLKATNLGLGYRSPVSLNFTAAGLSDTFTSQLIARGGLVMGVGSVIRTDPQTNSAGGVTLKGDTVSVKGSVIAPGGTIKITGGRSFVETTQATKALATVNLAATSYLSTAGVAVPLFNNQGSRIGPVLSGGNITVSGNIIAEKGAVLDVSGASGIQDLQPAILGLKTSASPALFTVRATRVDSNGGSISLEGAQELFTDATLIGRAGGPTGLGGNLIISSGRFTLPGEVKTPLDVTLNITQSADTIPGGFYPADGDAIGHAVLDKDGNAISGGYFAADRFNNGGFDALTLKGTVQFSGPVEFKANRSLNIASGGVLIADQKSSTSSLHLIAPYVMLGTPFQQPLPLEQQTSPFLVDNQPFYVPPTYGAGSLTVTASLIDIGNLSLRNIGQASLNAINGDIRGNGTFDIAGDLTLTAGQIYPPTACSFTLSAYDYLLDGQTQLGSITIQSSGRQQLPLSAGGVLNVFSSIINQGGTLRAPFGTINLGWNGVDAVPANRLTGQTFDWMSGQPYAKTHQLNLIAESETSVSAVDPITGKTLVIPYGKNLNGTSWIDPTGTDITVSGPPAKSINISAENISDAKGALIDIRGGGDLYAYRWVSGVGGTKDILASTKSFAVIPGYQSNAAPYDPGYSNSGLAVGDRIYLNASSGLPTGIYTLLPARYALLPGAYLVTPVSGLAGATVEQADGSQLVSGYRFNDLNTARQVQGLHSLFEVAPQSVVHSRAQYDDFNANTTFPKYAETHNVEVARLPVDSGQLALAATRSMTLEGSVTSRASAGGQGGMVDISSPGDIIIGSGNTGPEGTLSLDSKALSAFGADSLLIGGIRQTGPTGTTVTVTTNNVTLDNAGGTVLSGPDIILASNKSLTIADGASIEQTGNLSGAAQTLHIGNVDADGNVVTSGNGTLLRVSADADAQISRSGIGASTGQLLHIGAGAKISGAGITIDSTNVTYLNSSAFLSARAVSVSSGNVSLQLDNPGELQPTAGLVLSNAALANLQASAKALSLSSYSSLDIYGTGLVGSLDSKGNPTIESLALHAAELRGFNQGNGTVTIAAKDILLDNSPGGTSPGAVTSQGNGTLKFQAGTIRVGVNQLQVDQFAHLEMNTTGGILGQGNGGLSTHGSLTLVSPLITGAKAAQQTISAEGALKVDAPAGTTVPTITGGLGASLTLKGASVTTAAGSTIQMQSGKINLQATTGDLTVGGSMDAAGTRQSFDTDKYTSGGQIKLTADNGSVNLTQSSIVTVAAQLQAGDGGTLSVNAKAGSLVMEGNILGKGGKNGEDGHFILDAGTIATPNGSLTPLSNKLIAGGFTESQDIRIRTGNLLIDGLAKAHSFHLSADQGSITVAGMIDARGAQGGVISLSALRDITLTNGSQLTVAADDFDSAGKGGSVSLETRGNNGAAIELAKGSKIDLSVASANATSASLGRFTGTLHLRAPQTIDASDIQIKPIEGTISNASSIVVEGYKIYDLTSSGGTINTAVQTSVKNNGTTLGSHVGNVTTEGSITHRLLASNAALAPVFNVQTGAEIINQTGNLTLASDWNLSTFRFGLNNAPGMLTLRASGNLVFNSSLSDGFTSSAYTASLMDYNPLLPANAQSWSYRLTAGSDFTAVDFRQVQPLLALPANAGSVQVGKNGGTISALGGMNATTKSAISGLYQVIRTGAGNIDISAGRNIQLLNQFATIYTAGSLVPTPTTVQNAGDFDLPKLNELGVTDVLGAVQHNPTYPVQYSLGGGNVTLAAQGDIIHQTRNNQGVLIADSERQLPINWLNRRGYVDPTTGQFGTSKNSEVASTTWWVDFSNYFEGVGALGGGNVTLTAGNDITNVDAVIPTNARMPKGKPDASKLVELGGGNLTVHAGNNIDGGVYYVEKGRGTLQAGNKITTNSTRSPSLTTLRIPTEVLPSQTWLPTTLFLGKGSFDVTAENDLLLGPVANAFLLPEGYSNTIWYKTYFSTYAASDEVNVSSLTGAVTLRESTTFNDSTIPILQAWLQNVLLQNGSKITASYYQPWLRLNESSVDPFATVSTLMPATLRATAFSGDINIVGNLTLSPSPEGTLDLTAAQSINGLQIQGITTINGVSNYSWGPSTINLSDADPAFIPGISSPFAYQVLAGTAAGTVKRTGLQMLTFIDELLTESGSKDGVDGILQTKQKRHAAGVLHTNDTTPVYLYAKEGDISGFKLFSGKASRVIAGRDITDIALYVQNTRKTDVSVIAAGRDIVAYAPNSLLRVAAQTPASLTTLGNVLSQSTPQAGDIQISGPGTLEVLAGRNLDLGVGPNNSDGTGVGITSIGNTRNPYLPFEGADVIAGAGIGAAGGLSNSALDFHTFINQFLNPATANSQIAHYLPILGEMMNLTDTNDAQIWAAFSELSQEQQDKLALNLFYLTLRDAGRNRSNPASPGYGNYNQGFAAIAALFPGNQWQGNISLTSREIKTANGGNISLFAPGGNLTVGFDISGNQALDQGILTESGGDISIFTRNDVIVGTSRIFTLRGGDVMIWSSAGNIAAGASSKTVQSAPPTRVLIDPQSGDVKIDLAGLATGGGIGVLATVDGVAPGDVDLIAPSGTIDAGDAGIRVSGKLNVSAPQVLNSSNMQAGGGSTGTPSVSAPSISVASVNPAASTTTANSTAADTTGAKRQDHSVTEQMPSIISVEVLGYGGGEGDDDREKNQT